MISIYELARDIYKKQFRSTFMNIIAALPHVRNIKPIFIK